MDWKWLLGFNEEKCSILHLGIDNTHFKYNIGPTNKKTDLGITTLEKDLEVFIDPLLSFEEHVDKKN